MATHRRGLRPSQWPVRDLLGPDGGRGRVWDARIGAALAGLLACGAAVTVVLTSGDTASSDASSGTPQPRKPQNEAPQNEASQPEPWALPATPSIPAPAVPPAALPPAPAAPAVRVAPPRRTAPAPERPVARPRPVRPAAPTHSPDPTLTEQVAAGIEQWERRSPDRSVAGWVLVPVQRPADAAALLELACGSCTRETGGRHLAGVHDVERAEQHREGGRHRAPDPDDDPPPRDQSTGDRDEPDDADVHGRDAPDDRSERDRDHADCGDDGGDDGDRDENHHSERKEREHSVPDRSADVDEAPDDEPDEVQRSAADDRDASDEDDHDADEGYTGWFDAA